MKACGHWQTIKWCLMQSHCNLYVERTLILTDVERTLNVDRRICVSLSLFPSFLTACMGGFLFFDMVGVWFWCSNLHYTSTLQFLLFLLHPFFNFDPELTNYFIWSQIGYFGGYKIGTEGISFYSNSCMVLKYTELAQRHLIDLHKYPSMSKIFKKSFKLIF
jgi:hypothetical protein